MAHLARRTLSAIEDTGSKPVKRNIKSAREYNKI